MVLFPEPVGPTRATSSPGWISNDKPVSTGCLASYAKFTSENFTDVGKFQASYSVLKDDLGNKYAILFFPYFQDVSFAESELNVFLSPLYQIYFIMLVVAIGVLYCNPSESYEGAVKRQVAEAKKKSPGADLNKLLQSGHTWNVV